MVVIADLIATSVTRASGPILATYLDDLATGASSRTHFLTIRGWSVGKTHPVEAIEAVAAGHVLARANVDAPTPELAARFPRAEPWATNAGFSLTFDTLGLGPELEIRLRATEGNRPIARIGVVRGRRQPLRPPYQPRLQPLLVTSIGRTGTTLLMRLLAAHPAVVAYRRHPYEARAAKYWLHLLKSLARPVDPRTRPGQPNEFHLEPSAFGSPFATADFAAYDDAATWLGDGYLDDLAAFCLRSIDGWYGRVAAAQAQPEPAYWAEKMFPDDYAALTRELYPTAKEIVLVRDFRDMWASMRAYNERRGFGDFGQARADSEQAWLDEMRNGAVRLYETAQARGPAARVVRYEDIVADPAATIAAILAYLELDAAATTIGAMVAAAESEIPELRAHRTSATVEASLGRWQRDLSPEQQAMARAAFDDILPAFGYDPNA